MALLQVNLVGQAMSALPEDDDDRDCVDLDFAWRVHESLSTWTGRVDAKASIVLTLELAALGFVVALTDGKRLFAALTGWRECVFVVGLVLLAFGILAATAVVFPQLARRKARADWKQGLVYFGHLRRWTPADLDAKLEHLTTEQVRTALSAQLITMSKIAWRKHALLQASVLLGIVGAVAFALAGVG